MRRCGIAEVVVLAGLMTQAAACPLLIAGAAGGGAAGTVAVADDSRRNEHGPLTLVATVLADVVYVPAKLLFAGAGALTSGAAYLITVGDGDTSGAIWRSSVEGDYVLTPDMITGQKPVRFFGQ